jgi:hypothetical protein
MLVKEAAEVVVLADPYHAVLLCCFYINHTEGGSSSTIIVFGSLEGLILAITSARFWVFLVGERFPGLIVTTTTTLHH